MATNTPASKATPASTATTTHTVAKFVGHAGTERILTKADQDGVIGVKGVATKDLVWAPGNSKLDVTDAHEEVIAYLRSDDEFRVTTVDAPADAPAE